MWTLTALTQLRSKGDIAPSSLKSTSASRVIFQPSGAAAQRVRTWTESLAAAPNQAAAHVPSEAGQPRQASAPGEHAPAPHQPPLQQVDAAHVNSAAPADPVPMYHKVKHEDPQHQSSSRNERSMHLAGAGSIQGERMPEHRLQPAVTGSGQIGHSGQQASVQPADDGQQLACADRHAVQPSVSQAQQRAEAGAVHELPIAPPYNSAPPSSVSAPQQLESMTARSMQRQLEAADPHHCHAHDMHCPSSRAQQQSQASTVAYTGATQALSQVPASPLLNMQRGAVGTVPGKNSTLHGHDREAALHGSIASSVCEDSAPQVRQHLAGVDDTPGPSNSQVGVCPCSN